MSSFTVAANDQIVEPSPFNDVVLSYHNRGPIRVRDVGQAVDEPVDRTVAGYQNNKDGIILAVFKQPGANAIDTVDQIKAQLPQLADRIPASPFRFRSCLTESARQWQTSGSPRR